MGQILDPPRPAAGTRAAPPAQPAAERWTVTAPAFFVSRATILRRFMKSDVEIATGHGFLLELEDFRYYSSEH